jgi:hypothetical protein
MYSPVNYLAQQRRPPLWLAAAAVASGWAAVFSVGVWILQYVTRPVHEDVRTTYVAAEAGLRYGWSSIYNLDILRALSSSFPEDARLINEQLRFASPPLLAWLFVPLTALSEPLAYLVWAVVSLAALILAWHLAAPYTGIAKLTVLLLSLGLWPVMLVIYYGQPTMLVLALVASSWWLCTKDKPLEAGAALALATFLKPQAMIFVPAALLLSGRYRVVAGWAAGCAVLAIATVVNLGPSGLMGWWQALKEVNGRIEQTEYTLIHLIGSGPLTYILLGLQAAIALFVAWWRRRELEIVFAAGLIATVVSAQYFHESDYTTLILPAWLFLRTSPPLWHRLWLLAGVIPMQLMTYGPSTNQRIWDVAFHAPQIVWDAGWLAILAAGCLPRRRRPDRAAPRAITPDAAPVT